MSIGSFPESLSQAILVGIILVGRLGVVVKSSDPMGSSTDLIPITMYITLTLQTNKHTLWILPGAPTRRCACSSVYVWLHLKELFAGLFVDGREEAEGDARREGRELRDAKL